MKNLLFLLSILFTSYSFSQAHIGVMGGYDLENNHSQIGVGLNYMLLPKVSLGGMVMMSDLESNSKMMLMLNGKYHFGKISLVAGVMNMEMHDMDMSMNMNMTSMYGSDERETEPYFGIEYKPFKNNKLKVYFNYSDMMQSIGLMLPVFNLGSKMHMNH